MPNNFSILITGPFSSGKTSFIQTISQASGCLTYQSAISQTFCGQIQLGDDFLLLPEVRHLSRMEGLLGSLLGVILLVDNTQPETFREAYSIYTTVRIMYGLPVLVVANPKPPFRQELDESQVWDLDALAIALRLERDTPVVRCSVTNRDECKEALIRFMELVAAKIERERDDLNSEWFGFLHTFEPVVSASEFLLPERDHRWILLVGMDWWFHAHYLMDTLGEKSIWLRRNDIAIPIRVATIEVDESLSLHIFPYENFAPPRDAAVFALSHVLAMQNKSTVPITFEAERMTLDDSIIGVIGVLPELGSGGRIPTTEHILRATHLADVMRPKTLVYVDYARTAYNRADANSLPADIPRIEIASPDKTVGKQSILFLCNYLPTEFAERIRKKLNP